MPQFTDLNYFHQVVLVVEVLYLIYVLHDAWVDAGYLHLPMRKEYTLVLLCMGMGWALIDAYISAGFTIGLALVDAFTHQFCKLRRRDLKAAMKNKRDKKP